MILSACRSEGDVVAGVEDHTCLGQHSVVLDLCLADGGAVARASAPTLDRRSLQDAQQSFTEGVRGIQVVAKISDINRVQREVRTIEVQGDLR